MIKAGTCFPDWFGAPQQGQAELGRRHAHQSWRVLTCLESGLGGVGRALCHSQKPQGTRVGRQRGAGEGGCSPGSVGREAPSEAGPQAAPRARPARPGHTAPCWRSRPESAASQTACPSRRVWGAGRGRRLLFLRRPGARRPVSNTEVPVGRLRGVPQGPVSDAAEHEACPGTRTPCPTHHPGQARPHSSAAHTPTGHWCKRAGGTPAPTLRPPPVWKRRPGRQARWLSIGPCRRHAELSRGATQHPQSSGLHHMGPGAAAR